jgi:TonB-dependent SusC/RagA subfamily outer membrane receptor
MKRFSLLLLLAATLPGFVFAQTGTIRGTVFDAETGLPLPGANVVVVELTIGAATTVDGEYAIDNIPVGPYTVRTSFVGFRTLEQQVNVVEADLSLDVRLDVDHARHDEILVTGIASRRSRATSDVAVGRIDAAEPLKNNAYQDVTQLINGRVSGVTVQPASGNVASGLRFIMRSSAGLGDGQPIVYIDGARVHHYQEQGFGVGGQGVSQLAHLNPDDIESIDILKGPAGSALYGTSGANGVVLITTRKGSLGSGIRQGSIPFGVTYEGTLGANRQAEDYTVFNSSTPEATNAIFRNGALSEHVITASGGSQSVRFHASYGNRSEDGHILNSSQDRQSFRANLEAFPSNLFTVRANTAFVRNDVERPQNDANENGWLFNTSILPVPYLVADSAAIANLINLQQVTRFTGSAEVEYRPLRGLSVKALVGYDGTDMRNDHIRPAGFRYAQGDQGARGILDKEDRLLTFDLNARYDYSITPELRGATTVGTQGIDSESQSNGTAALGFATDLILAIDAGDNLVDAWETSINIREMGVFAAQDFSYGDKVFVALGLRRDYASAFGFEAPSILYPRLSAAVRMDNLISLPGFLPFLKLRAAYGEAGRLPGPLDGHSVLWGAVAGGYGAGAIPQRWGNPEIQPERTKEIEAGLEAGFLSNQLNLELTYYRQNADNNIVSLPNPLSSGFGPAPFNIASAKGSGLEAMLSTTPIRSARTSLEMTLIWNWMDNEVTELGGAPPIFDPFSVNVFKEGLPREAYYTWRSVADFNEDGSYAGPKLGSGDEDGDGLPDREFLGAPYPEQSGSFQFTFRFLKNFHLSGVADWQLGVANLDVNQWTRVQSGTDAARNVAAVQLGLVEDPCTVRLCDSSGSLKPEFAEMNVAALPVGSEGYRAAGEVFAGTEVAVDGTLTFGNWVHDASFFTLRELSLRYDFTSMLMRASGGRYVRSLSLTLAGRNLFMSSPYPGPDPVASSHGAMTLSRGGWLTLPNPRVIYAKLSVGI